MSLWLHEKPCLLPFRLISKQYHGEHDGSIAYSFASFVRSGSREIIHVIDTSNQASAPPSTSPPDGIMREREWRMKTECLCFMPVSSHPTCDCYLRHVYCVIQLFVLSNTNGGHMQTEYRVQQDVPMFHAHWHLVDECEARFQGAASLNIFQKDFKRSKRDHSDLRLIIQHSR
jgi:hypothetical protein